MGHKCYISFKTEDSWYKREIQKWSANEKVDMIDKSLNTPINSEDEDYIMRKIIEDYFSDSIFSNKMKGSDNIICSTDIIPDPETFFFQKDRLL